MRNDDPEPPPDVPSWLLTYSDVITLLMTFFILLLTFATSEPETFEKMQLATFGSAGSFGLVRERTVSLDKDSILVRQRPRASRLSPQGSELPPIYSDPGFDAVEHGLRSLDQQDPQALEKRYAIDVPLPLVVTEQGELSEVGRKLLDLLAGQLRKLPLQWMVEVYQPHDLDAALRMATYLTEVARVPPFKVAVGLSGRPAGLERRVRWTVSGTGGDGQ